MSIKYIGIDPSLSSTGILIHNENDYDYSVKVGNKENTAGRSFFFSKIIDVNDNFDKEKLPLVINDNIYYFNKDKNFIDVTQTWAFYSVFKDTMTSILTPITTEEIYVGIEVPFGIRYGSDYKMERIFGACLIVLRQYFETCSNKWGIFTFTPSRLKKFVTDNGRAPKVMMMKEVYKRWGFESSVEDVVEAYGIAKLTCSVKSGK